VTRVLIAATIIFGFAGCDPVAIEGLRLVPEPTVHADTLRRSVKSLASTLAARYGLKADAVPATENWEQCQRPVPNVLAADHWWRRVQFVSVSE